VNEHGFTVVEAVVAAFVLVLGVLGALQLVDAGNRGTFRATQGQVLVNRAEAELEEIKKLPFQRVALTEAPQPGSADLNNPSSRLSEGSFALARDGSELRPLIVNQSEDDLGEVQPVGEFSSGDVSGTIYRYVVASSDATCPAPCEHLKRVIVAVVPDRTASGGDRGYQELQSDIVDPDVTPEDNPLPPGEENEIYPATFWLTDTGCDQGTRQEITGSHLTHRTGGICSDGTVMGSDPPAGGGAPDLMGVEQPILCEHGDDSCDPEVIPPLYDYSAEVEGDRGLQLERPGTSGCALNSLLSDPLFDFKQQHLWLSRPIQEYGLDQLVLVKRATLSLWTRAATPMQGRVCVYLFKREAGPTIVDVAVPDSSLNDADYFMYPSATGSMQWPTEWTEITVPMNYASNLTLWPDERLGLGISVEASGTGSAAPLQFAYDHPNYESRLEVESHSLIGGLLGD
jgi:hypothetical protein